MRRGPSSHTRIQANERKGVAAELEQSRLERPAPSPRRYDVSRNTLYRKLHKLTSRSRTPRPVRVVGSHGASPAQGTPQESLALAGAVPGVDLFCPAAAKRCCPSTDLVDTMRPDFRILSRHRRK